MPGILNLEKNRVHDKTGEISLTNDDGGAELCGYLLREVHFLR